jgi:LysR family cys regulon transcriptional activator
VVPTNHDLTRIKDITLSELARFPILTYMLGLTGRSQLDKTFQRAKLEPQVAFTATDSDIIKTYVRLGMGAGIVAEMACRDEDSDLVYIDARHLFPDSVIKVGFRHSRHISAYQFEFLHMVAPYLEMETIRQLAGSRTLQDREKLLEKIEVPSFRDMRNSLSQLKVVG